MATKLSLLAITLLLAGCATDNSLSGSVGGNIVWQYPKDPPAWVLVAPEPDDRGIHFLGLSGLAKSEVMAKQLAVADSLNQLARYVGVNVNVLNHYITAGSAKESEPMDSVVSATVSTTLAAETMINKGTHEWFLRRIRKEGVEYFKARVLLTVSQDQVQLITDYVDERKQADIAAKRKARSVTDAIVAERLEKLKHAGGTVVVGVGTANGKMPKIMAEQAAIMSAKHDAFVKLNSNLNGVRVVGAISKDSVGNTNGATSVIHDGNVRAEVVSEVVEWENGIAVATIVLKTPQ